MRPRPAALPSVPHARASLVGLAWLGALGLAGCNDELSCGQSGDCAAQAGQSGAATGASGAPSTSEAGTESPGGSEGTSGSSASGGIPPHAGSSASGGHGTSGSPSSGGSGSGGSPSFGGNGSGGSPSFGGSHGGDASSGTSNVAGTDGSGGSGGSAAGGDGSVAGAAGQGPTLECTGDPREPGCGPSAEHGYFVSPLGSDQAAGTESAPLGTLEEALSRAHQNPQRRAIYLCADAGDYVLDHTLELTPEEAGGLSVYGAISCSGENAPWRHDPTLQANLISTEPLAVRLEGFDSSSASFELDGVTLQSADASDPGQSSIALLAIESPAVVLSEVVLQAGRGADGQSATAYTEKATNGASGTLGRNQCTADPSGGQAVVTDCSAGITSRGGKGGDGATDTTPPEPGAPGEPPAQQNAGAAQTETELCTKGGDGAAGNHSPDQPYGAGTAKAGSAPESPGRLGPNGFLPAHGQPGAAGEPGQGGGGGGGALAPATCSGGSAPATGASGGSGGGGGCGGKGGDPGGGGGASIALALVDSPLTLQNVSLRAQTGGNGGSGAAGQIGGIGSAGGGGGAGDYSACAGGWGGNGGKGGPGSGGAGGPSLGLGYVGEAPSATEVSATVADTPAPGGLDGTETSPSPAGPTADARELDRAE